MTYEVEILWESCNTATIWGHAHDDAQWYAQEVTWNIDDFVQCHVPPLCMRAI